MILFVSATAEKTWRSMTLALRSLWLHKLRAFLSMLGIIIGTSAVIALMAFGEGSMQDALEDIRRQGATNIIVRSVKPPEDGASVQRSFVASYGLTRKDYDYLRDLPTIVNHVPVRDFRQEVRFQSRAFTGRVVGTTPGYADVHQLPIIAGRFLIADDGDNLENNAVLGSNLATQLFPFDDPLGESVVISGNQYRIVGLLGERLATGGTGGSSSGENFNDDIYIPLSTVDARFGEKVFVRATGSRSGEQVELHQITLTVSGVEKVRSTGEVIKNWLERTHGPRKRDWELVVPLDRLEAAEREKTRYTQLLAMIASISLLVGGIGIMNIMLATVTERTREVGIRRALGAKRRDITMQFLIEAVVQTTIGGAVGVLVGLGLVLALPPLWDWFGGGHLPASVHIPAIFIAVTASVVVGVLSGLYPALRAAHLDPIEALRHV